MHFEHVYKCPGHKFTLWWGGSRGYEGQFTVYVGTNSHPFVKFYFFRSKYAV